MSGEAQRPSSDHNSKAHQRRSVKCPKCGHLLEREDLGRGQCPKCELHFKVSPQKKLPSTPDLIRENCPQCHEELQASQRDNFLCPHCHLPLRREYGRIVADTAKSSVKTWLFVFVAVALLAGAAVAIFPMLSDSLDGTKANQANVVSDDNVTAGELNQIRNAVSHIKDSNLEHTQEHSMDSVIVGSQPVSPNQEPDDDEPKRMPEDQGRWRIPVSAGDRLMIDGIELLPVNFSQADWSVVIPHGDHLIQRGELPPELVSVRFGFVNYYQNRKAEVTEDGDYLFDRLLESSRQSFGIFRDPLLAHFWGNFYWQQGNADAAIRNWSSAILLEPSFAPSHLNLSFAYLERDEIGLAKTELQLARHFNHHDAYGLWSFITELNKEKDLLDTSSPLEHWDLEQYRWKEPSTDLTSEQQYVIRGLKTMQQYITQESQRIRMVNNIGAYLLSESNPTEAYSYLHPALENITTDPQLQADRELIKTLLINIAESMEQRQMAEFRFFRQLSAVLE